MKAIAILKTQKDIGESNLPPFYPIECAEWDTFDRAVKYSPPNTEIMNFDEFDGYMKALTRMKEWVELHPKPNIWQRFLIWLNS